MDAEERESMTNEMIKLLIDCQRFELQDIKNKYAPQTEGETRDMMLALWDAKEFVRTTKKIDFAPLRGFPGVFERCDWTKLASRSRRQRAAARRKEARALSRMILAAELAPTSERERLEKEADRQRLKMAMRKRGPRLPGLEE